jgi:uncharacterized protein YggT (Ycf19 family)
MARTVQHARRTEYVDRDADDYPEDAVAAPQTILARVVWFAAGIILALLALRFILSLLGANTTNAFANFIYDTSQPFVSPFFNLFNYNVIDYGVARFEIYTLVAMLVYALIASGIAYLLTITRR